MTRQRSEPQSWPKAAGVVVMEGQSGEARDAVVERRLAERRDDGGPIWRLQCRPQDGGAWAGLARNSEYYNDRGAVHFKMGLLEHAERDYLAAIELSPSYPEVWTNLGQCYRAMERMDQAVRAYTRALDLDPSSTLALVGRADAQFALDHAELAALADYDRALTIEPKQPLARDLTTYLELRPDAEHRGEVEESLSALARA
jgi:tetratricopeptide (TPR) repeat protein